MCEYININHNNDIRYLSDTRKLIMLVGRTSKEKMHIMSLKNRV